MWQRIVMFLEVDQQQYNVCVPVAMHKHAEYGDYREVVQTC